MSDNGHDTEKAKEVLTPEEAKKQRLGRYTKDPNSFIEVTELVCAAIKDSRSSLGISVMVGHVSRNLMDVGQVELNHMMNKIRLNLDIKTEMSKANRIQQPGAMRRFAGKIMKGKR